MGVAREDRWSSPQTAPHSKKSHELLNTIPARLSLQGGQAESHEIRGPQSSPCLSESSRSLPQAIASAASPHVLKTLAGVGLNNASNKKNDANRWSGWRTVYF
eukprot:1158106-Pelagomonas_calceolata.AAC.9